MSRAIFSAIAGAGVAFASIFLYVQPPECSMSARCQVGIQRGGFPFAVVQDQAAGSPVSGWGKISLDDFLFADGKAFLLNSLCYAAVVWSLVETAAAIQRHSKPPSL